MSGFASVARVEGSESEALNANTEVMDSGTRVNSREVFVLQWTGSESLSILL